jgi:hypothetical protein
MQEVATGKYHGHSFGDLNGVPPTDEIGRSVLSVRRTDATITFILLRCRWSPIGRFCCRSLLKAAGLSDSVAVKRFATGASDDGAALCRPAPLRWRWKRTSFRANLRLEPRP